MESPQTADEFAALAAQSKDLATKALTQVFHNKPEELSATLDEFFSDPRLHAKEWLLGVAPGSSLSPFNEACRRGHASCAIEMLNRGLPVDGVSSASSPGVTPLGLAAHIGSYDLVARLIGAGADIELPDSYGSRALKHAAARNKTAIVELLIACGAQLDAVDVGGTPLSAAIHNGAKESMMMLLEAGADPDVLFGNGETARDIVAEGYVSQAMRDCVVLFRVWVDRIAVEKAAGPATGAVGPGRL